MGWVGWVAKKSGDMLPDFSFVIYVALSVFLSYTPSGVYHHKGPSILCCLQYGPRVLGSTISLINNYIALSCIVYVASSYLSLQQVLDFSPRHFEYDVQAFAHAAHRHRTLNDTGPGLRLDIPGKLWRSLEP